MNIKEIILNCFKIPETHPTEAELYQLVLEKTSISKENFQAELNILIKNNSVYTVKSSDKQIHFGREKGPHFHFICQDCGKVRDFVVEEGAMNMMKHYIQKRIHSFGAVEQINLSVSGRCYECHTEN